MEAFVLDEKITEDYLDVNERSEARAKRVFNQMNRALTNITHLSKYLSQRDAAGIRTLKITEISFVNYSGKYYHYPHIRLAGRWLERAGFNLGDTVQVITIHGMVLIVPMQPPKVCLK
ncbi:hypothetical protein A3860_33850 [Niastella vici]|uniref:Toxin SymE-like domain-containing protein n=1 Tax=Niastella vici TaxID=1703345 RepID=A0A1V9FQ36_9BACT|nr:SymE family type I addiction module toxin [Niastella vici]OQP60366.1 hypothetical protein A3860_33850 [Niastella vici]